MAAITVRIDALLPSGNFPLTMTEDTGQVTNGSLVDASLQNDTAGFDAQILDDSKPNGDQYRQIGARLFALLFPEPLLTQWRVRAAERPLLRLDIVAEKLGDLPWELLYDSDTNLYLSFTGGVVRLTTRPSAQCKCSAWPLRLLLVNGASKDEEAELGVKEELESIIRTFLPLGRSVDAELLVRPSRQQLMDWIECFHPHVFHFSGHAVAFSTTNQAGLMMESNPNWLWDAGAIPNDLAANGWTPSFVFLNACRTGASRGPVGTVLDAFSKQGTAAVIATQANVRGDQAAVFATELYKRMADGEDVIAATARARAVLVNSLGGYDHKAWALPVLTVNREAMVVQPPRLGPRTEWPTSPEFAECREFEEARYFAGVHAKRRDLTQWFFPVRVPPEPPNVFLVSGPPLSGKSHLVKWCLENYVLGKVRIRYVEVRESGPKDFLGLLRQIRDGDASRAVTSGRLLHGELPALAFRRFNWEINHLLGPQGVKPEWKESDHPPGQPIEDVGLPLSDKGSETPIKDVFDSYVVALRELVKTEPLLLALDQFRGLEGDRLVSAKDLELLTKYLFRPIADAPSSSLRLVLVLDDYAASEVRRLLPKERMKSLTVDDNFSVDELVNHVLEMFRYPEGDNRTALADAAQSLLKLPTRLPHRGLARLHKFREDAEKGYIDLAVERMR